MLGQLEERYGFGLRGVPRDALRLLTQHAWRGNVRELEAVLEQAAIFARRDWITAEDLGLLTPRLSREDVLAGDEEGMGDRHDGFLVSPVTHDAAFEQRHKCQGISPEIRLTDVPGGAASYDVVMTDLDVPSFHHWRQTIAVAGPTVPEGARVGHFGPCPPSGTHRYSIEVTARDGQKRPVAHGEKTVLAGR